MSARAMEIKMSLAKLPKPLTGCEHAVRRACKNRGEAGARVGVSQRGKPEDTHTAQIDGPPEVSCLYSVMSRLSAVGFPDERDAIAELNGVEEV